jgi:C-terminal processing protease CtpA/Prc
MHVFNDVCDFGDDCDETSIQHPAEITRCGVGLMLQRRYVGSSQLLLVDAIVPGGAADACRRIMVGDAVLSVDGRSVNAFPSFDAAIESLMGLRDTPVTLLLHRALTGSSYTVTLTRRVHKSAELGSSNSRNY